MCVSRWFYVLTLNLSLLLVFQVWLPQGDPFPWRAEAGGSSTFSKSLYLATVMDPDTVHVLPAVFPGVIYCDKILAHSLGGFSSFNVPHLNSE